MWRELFRLLRAWWSVDRIRVSPREGRLFRLRAGDVIAVDGRSAEVDARSAGSAASPPRVTYECLTAYGSARLTVQPACPGRSATVIWTEAGRTAELREADVEVFRRPDRA